MHIDWTTNGVETAGDSLSVTIFLVFCYSASGEFLLAESFRRFTAESASVNRALERDCSCIEDQQDPCKRFGYHVDAWLFHINGLALPFTEKSCASEAKPVEKPHCCIQHQNCESYDGRGVRSQLHVPHEVFDSFVGVEVFSCVSHVDFGVIIGNRSMNTLEPLFTIVKDRSMIIITKSLVSILVANNHTVFDSAYEKASKSFNIEAETVYFMLIERVDQF